MIESLPMAVAIALSPFAIIPAILSLFSERPRITASGFLVGWFLGIGAITSVVVLATDLIDLTDIAGTWTIWLRIILGAAILIMVISRFSAKKSTSKTPAWMSVFESATPAKTLSLGLLLSAANPKTLLLAASGGATIGSQYVSSTPEWVAILVFTCVGSVTVAAPLVLHLLAGKRIIGPLNTLKKWLERNSNLIMTVILAIIGLVVLYGGATDLLQQMT